MVNLSLSNEEIQIILESLLFSSSADVCADWYKNDIDAMLDLAKKLRFKHQDIPTENVYIITTEKNNFCDEITKDIINVFPELEIKEKQLI